MEKSGKNSNAEKNLMNDDDKDDLRCHARLLRKYSFNYELGMHADGKYHMPIAHIYLSTRKSP